MTMSDDTDRKERDAALDEFAQSTEVEGQLVPIMPQGQVATQVFGAQNVAVRRDERIILNKIRALAAAAGQEWFYRFPVRNKKKGTTDYIEGPSIKMANDLARLYGNCDVDCRAVDIGSHILFTARFIDLETGYSLTRPFQQRKGASQMGSDSDRQSDITFQIGASKAIRNVIINALQTYADFAFDHAKTALTEKISGDLEAWRQRTHDRLKERVDPRRAEVVVGRPWKEWLATDIARVITMMKGVSDGMASLDETFPPLAGEESKQAAAAPTAEMDQFASTDSGRPQERGSGPSPTPVAEQAESDHPDPLASGSATSHDYRPEVIEKAITMVTRYGKSEQQHLDALDALVPMLNKTIPDHPDFVDQVVRTASDVALKRTPADDARKYLRGLIK